MNHRLFANFASDLYAAESYDDAFDVFYQFATDSGFGGISYSYIPHINIASSQEISPIFKTGGKLQKQFVEYYGLHQLYKNDFVIRLIKQGRTEPIDWWQSANDGHINQAELELLELSRDKFGIENGITIPTMSTNRGIAGVIFVTDKKNLEYKQLKQQALDTIELAAKIFHAMTIASPESTRKFVLPHFPELAEKEIQVLRFLISGKPMKMVEEATDISPKYAEKLLVNIRKKFGDISTHELIHQVGIFNILD